MRPKKSKNLSYSRTGLRLPILTNRKGAKYTFAQRLRQEKKEEKLNKCGDVVPSCFYCVIPNSEIIPRNEIRLEALSDNSSYLILTEDKLFPYTRQDLFTGQGRENAELLIKKYCQQSTYHELQLAA